MPRLVALLQPICIGASVCPFCWKLGDVTHEGAGGNRWYALGPLRLGVRWRK